MTTTRPALALAALLCAAPPAPAAEPPDPLDAEIARAKCRDLPAMEDRMECYGWVAQAVEAERRWEEERAGADAAPPPAGRAPRPAAAGEAVRNAR